MAGEKFEGYVTRALEDVDKNLANIEKDVSLLYEKFNSVNLANAERIRELEATFKAETRYRSIAWSLGISVITGIIMLWIGSVKINH